MPGWAQIVLVACFAAQLAGIACARANEGEPAVITVGLIDTFSPTFYVRTYAPTLEYLIRTLPQYRFNVVEIDYRRIEEDVQANKPAFIVTSASGFVSLIDKFGAHQVATRRQKGAGSAQTVASTYLVKAESPMQTLADARGRRAAVSSTQSFDGWLIARGDIEARFGRSSSFFSDVISTEYGIPDVAMLVKMGLADIGVLGTCEYEGLVSTGQIDPKAFRLLDEKSNGEGCVRSTERYPDVVFSSLPNVDEDVTKAVTMALLAMPAEGMDFTWSIANDFVPTYTLLKTLKLGPYAPQPWTPDLVWRTYRIEILLMIGLILAVVFHIVTINRLVRKRTAELQESVRETEHFYREVQSVRSKLLQVERLSIVSQLSSMFAHEIKQPIMNISLYAGALKLYLQKEGILTAKAENMLARVEDEVERSSQIVEHVRSYAKKSASQPVSCPLRETVAEVLKSASSNVGVEVDVRDELEVLADPFELQFIVANFIKNARSAVESVAHPSIRVTIEERGGKAVLTVSDNGPKISDVAFAELGHAKMSAKPDGLGFGLSIAMTLAEKMGGHIEFCRRQPTGLSVSLVLRKVEDERA